MRAIALAAGALLLIATLAADMQTVASAAECLPGGEATRKAVAARRGKTALSKLAASMKPGTWAELKTEMPAKLWSAPAPSKGLHIGTWSDDAHWDSQSGQLLFFGFRQSRKFIAYDEATNAWREIPLPEDHEAAGSPSIVGKFGHQYSLNAFDPQKRRFYTGIHRYDLATGKWAKLPEPPQLNAAGSMVFEYSSALNGLLRLARPGFLQFYSEDRQMWESLGKIDVHGYHSLARHNPLREEVLFCGGNDSQAVVILSKDGKLKRMKDFPVPITVRHAAVTVDPVSGKYLMLGNGREFYEFDSKTNEYRKLAEAISEKGFGRKVGFIPEYGVTIFADQKVWLYKHDAAASDKP